METHANHLHHAPGKKFLHYLYEFLMLFLAIFSGFLAENMREHMVERKREEVFIKNLYEDLKDDVVNYTDYDKSCTTYLATIDSMIFLMGGSDRDLHLNRIYFLARSATMKANSFFSPNVRTFEQMKYSGSLRLISNRQVADSVSAYYYSLKKVEFQNEVIRDRITGYMVAVGRVFDAQVLFQILKEKQEPAQGSLKLLSDNPMDINEMLTGAQYYYGSRLLQKNQCLERMQRAKSLLEIISNEYHLQ